MPLKTKLDIEKTVETVTKAIQVAARQATPGSDDNTYVTHKHHQKS
jgi:hypothetical protein